MRKKFSILVAVGLLSAQLVGCGQVKETVTTETTVAAQQQFKPGTYTGTGSGNNGDITVETTFSETEILSVKVVSHSETESIAASAIERMPQSIIDAQSLAVDTVTGATNMSSGILAAVEDCVKQAGGDVELLKTQVEKEDEEVVTEELTTQVVVVGGGAAGSAAALAASESGAEVILLEKAPTISGAGTLAGVLFASESTMQKEAGKEVDPEWLYDEYIKGSNYHANAKLVSAIIEKSSSTVDWLVDNGVNLNLLDAGANTQYAHVGMPTTAHGYADGGDVAIATLHDKITSYGGKVMYETPATELLFDDNGKVTGVVAKKADGTILNIKADSVILATGGFGGNKEKMAEVFGEKAGTGLVATATGDGLEMAWSAGAAELGLDVAQWFGMKYDSANSKKMQDSSQLTKLVRHPLLFVNKYGERFGNEEEAYESAALGTMMYTQPDAEMYVVFDKGIIEEVAQKGLAEVFADRYGHLYGQGVSYKESGHLKDLDAMCEENRTPFDFTATVEDAINAGVVVAADSIEELAEKLNAPKLVEEVKQYNELCANGKDTVFHKDAKYLNAVDEGPYYAAIVKLRCLSTLGGVAIDENIQAVDAEGNPIENLWVAGADAGGMYGDSYVTFEGGTLGFAYNSGRIAGENAAKNATEK